MASPPPSYATSASVSRSKISRYELGSLADEMLRASLTRGVTSHRSSSAVSSATAPPSYSRSSRPENLESPISPAPPGPLSDQAKLILKSDRKTIEALLARSTTSSQPREGGTAGGSPSSTSAAEAKLRIRQLQQEVDRANAKLARRDTTGLFKRICSTDLLFLIDTTGSMHSYIQSAKEQVRSIVNDIKKAFLNESEIRVAVVGYKDHSDRPNIQLLDLTLSTDEVSRFLDTLVAIGGGDLPEDVLGGVQQALNASWQQQTRCIIHIADAPAHGRDLHDLSDSRDDYPNPGGQPHHLTYEPLLKQLIKVKINYTLLRITSCTDRMALAFARIYAAGDGELNLFSSNKYYGKSDSSQAKISSSVRGGINSKRSTGDSTEPRFEEQLGTTYSALGNLVVKTVTASVSRTASRLTMALSSSGTTSDAGGRVKKSFPGLASITESESRSDPLRDSLLETAPPQWDSPEWLDETLMVEGFCPDVVLHGAATLNEMMDADEYIKLSVAKLTIHARSRPFAQGALRVASYARTAASTSQFVIKSYKEEGKELAYFIEDMRIQALCKAFALEFNSLLKTEHPIDFIATTCLQSKAETTPGKQNRSLEPFIEGDYIKYNNNSLWVNEDIPDDPMNLMAQAFSHFTFERSWGQLLVNDLQGVGRILTDTSIQTLNPERFKLADTNLNSDGFKCFFAAHKCNSICRKLGLKTNGEMFSSRYFQFRERWPTMDPTVCCSNKLCRRIVRLAQAHESDKFPGYHWCNACWPQLQSSMTRWICIETGTNHEFDVSRFFYESQGRSMPHRCPDHRERDPTVLSAAAVGGKLWGKMKLESKPRSISGRMK